MHLYKKKICICFVQKIWWYFFKNTTMKRVVEKYLCFSKKVSTPPIHILVGSSYVFLKWMKKNIFSLNGLVSNSFCLEYLCILTFFDRCTDIFGCLIYDIILSNIFGIWWIYSLCQPCLMCPFKLLFHFFISCLNLLKGKQAVFWPLQLKIAFFSLKDIFLKR